MCSHPRRQPEPRAAASSVCGILRPARSRRHLTFPSFSPGEGESLPRPARALKLLSRPQQGSGQPAFLPPSPPSKWEVASREPQKGCGHVAKRCIRLRDRRLEASRTDRAGMGGSSPNNQLLFFYCLALGNRRQ